MGKLRSLSAREKLAYQAIKAIVRSQNRILQVMNIGTGKAYTAFQVIWRLWKSKANKRILFFADRNILVDQIMTNDFKPFGSAMAKIQKRQANKSYGNRSRGLQLVDLP